MLSFMKESQAEALLEKNTEMSAQQGGASGANDQAFLTVSGHDKKVRHSTVIVLVLFGVAAVGLFFMMKHSRQHAVAAAAPNVEEQAKIETAISRLTGARAQMLSQMDSMVKKFYEFSDVMQVNVNELQKNPFQLEFYVSNDDIDNGAVDLVEKTLRKQFQQEVKELSLASIISSGEERQCRINEKRLLEGDRIGNFKVVHIADAEVELQWDPQDKDISQLTPEERSIRLSL